MEFIASIIVMSLAISYPAAKHFLYIFPFAIYIPIGTLIILAFVFSIQNLGRALSGFLVIFVPIAALLWLYKETHFNIDANKFTQFTLTLVIFGYLLGIVLQSDFAKRYIYWALLLNGLIILAYMLINPSISAYGRVVIGEGNPIWVARSITYSAIAGILMVFCGPRYKFLGLVIFIISLIGIYITGTRQSLLASMTCFVIFWTFSGKSNKSIFVVLFAITAFLILTTFEFNIGTSDNRVFNVSNLGSVRIEIFKHSFSLMANAPEGIGVGAYYFNSSTVYPHNIFVEFILEWGVFYGTILNIIIVLGAARIFIDKDPYMMPFKLLLVSELLNCSISGNIITPRLLYGLVFFGLILILSPHKHSLNRVGNPKRGLQ